MEKFKEFWRTKWHIVVIVVLVLFGFSKCTTSCSRNQKIKSLTIEMNSKDSLITVYEDSIRYLNYDNKNLGSRLSDEKHHSDAFEGIATGNQKELNAKISSLQKEVNTLKSENKKLKEENEKLKAKQE